MYQRGISHILVLLVVITTIGLISFLLISNTAPFKNSIFSNLFPKSVSKAATGTGKPQVGAFFFYWHDCPNNNCETTHMDYLPTYINTYSSTKPDWYKNEFTDMTQAGVSVVFPVSWGSGHPTFTWFRDTTDVPLMVNAITQNNIPIKVGYFDDTNSVDAEWNLDNGRGYVASSSASLTDRQGSPYYMPLSDNKNWMYFYDRKLKPFFKMVPQNLWATHNGQSVDNDGRPLIVIYSSLNFKDLQYSDQMWQVIKNSFQNDFKNNSGQGINPFIILDYDWLIPAWNSGAANLAKVVDAEYVWGANNTTIERRYNLNNYTTVELTSGFGCVKGSSCTPQPRNVNFVTGAVGDEGEWLRSMYQKYNSSTADLILIESWNELWEGTGIEKSPYYPKNGGGYLPDNYYINLLRGLVSSTSTSASLVSSVSTNNQVRNDFGDFVGMKITVGSTPITVTDLGRYFVSGNNQTHTLKIVDASSGSDLGSVSLDMNAGSTDSLGFKYATLSTPLTLSANTSYYVLSSETMGGDQWYGNTILPTVTTTSDVAVNSGIYHIGNTWNQYGNPGNSYGPLNFKYLTPISSFVSTVATNGQLRNDYSDFVGMQISVGTSPLTVTDLGRYFVTGNNRSHILKIVDTGTGSDLASVSLDMNAGSTDSLGFKYATLSTPVTLSANSNYYIVSSETSNGDSWYGNNILPVLITSPLATTVSGVYHGGSIWYPFGTTSNSYGPLNFKYVTPIPTPAQTSSPSSTISPSPSPTPSPTVSPSGTIGNTHIGNTVDSSDSNYMDGSIITVGTSNISSKSISVYVADIDSSAANRSYQVAIYADNNGSPGRLVASSATGTLTANSWNSLSITTNLSANTSYWLMYNTNGTNQNVNNLRMDNGTAGQGAWSNSSIPFGSWPTSFGQSTLAPQKWSIYLTY